MLMYEIKDVVRSMLGRDQIPLHMMNYMLNLGRRSAEQYHNFHWMRAVADWSTVVGQQVYNIVAPVLDDGLGLTDFKDSRILFTKATTETVWQEVEFDDFNKLDLTYATDDTGQPEMAIIDNTSIALFPQLATKRSA